MRGVKTPVLLGGAALTRDYAEETISPTSTAGPLLYCRDAFDGLKVMDHVSSNKIDALYTEQTRPRRQKRKTQLRANAVKPVERSGSR